MNIFVLNEDPLLAAHDHCNKHVVKMIVESAQLLVTAFPAGTTAYKHTHFNHPCAKWVRASLANWWWLWRHHTEMCAEYTKRYNKIHKTEFVTCALIRPDLPNIGLTPFAQAMPEKYRGPDPVAAYRSYYIAEKARFAKWAPRTSAPAWWPYQEAL